MALEMFAAYPNRARHVRTLHISLNQAAEHGHSYNVQRSRALQDGYKISACVRKAATNMEVLNKFVWDADEIAPNDDMWFALRFLCVSDDLLWLLVG